jgi:hypothetical protein
MIFREPIDFDNIDGLENYKHTYSLESNPELLQVNSLFLKI